MASEKLFHTLFNPYNFKTISYIKRTALLELKYGNMLAISNELHMIATYTLSKDKSMLLNTRAHIIGVSVSSLQKSKGPAVYNLTGSITEKHLDKLKKK